MKRFSKFLAGVILCLSIMHSSCTKEDDSIYDDDCLYHNTGSLTITNLRAYYLDVFNDGVYVTSLFPGQSVTVNTNPGVHFISGNSDQGTNVNTSVEVIRCSASSVEI